LSVTPPGIFGRNAADFRSLINVCQSHHQESAARLPQNISQSVSCLSSSWNFNEICGTDAADFFVSVHVKN
jgi:hypothetical protein